MDEKLEKLIDNLESSETVDNSKVRTPEQNEAAYRDSKDALRQKIQERVEKSGSGSAKVWGGWEPPDAISDSGATVRELPTLPDENHANLPCVPSEVAGSFFAARKRMAQTIEKRTDERRLEGASEEDKDIIELCSAFDMSLKHLMKMLSRKIAQENLSQEETPFEDWLMSRYSHINAVSPREVIQHLEEKDDRQSARCREIDNIELRTNAAENTIRSLKTDYARLLTENIELKKRLGIWGKQDDSQANKFGRGSGDVGDQQGDSVAPGSVGAITSDQAEPSPHGAESLRGGVLPEDVYHFDWLAPEEPAKEVDLSPGETKEINYPDDYPPEDRL